MSKKNNTGIVYIMTTVVQGLIKIGRSGSANYEERMRNLEATGYYNVVGLKRLFAIEVKEFEEKEKLLIDLFSRHRVEGSELFALDYDLVRQLLLSFEGNVIYPKEIVKDKEFMEITKIRKQSLKFNFYDKGVKNGDTISFVGDKSIKAVVCGEIEVEYEGQIWKLSPLTYKIFQQKNNLNKSGAYQGANYFEFKGVKLKDLKDN